MASLNSMPEEILEGILSRLPFKEIIVCSIICKRFRAVIKAAPSIQYRIALGFCGLHETPSSGLPISERLQRLRWNFNAWHRLNFGEPVRVTMSGLGNWAYALQCGYLVRLHQRAGVVHIPANESSSEVLVIRLPTPSSTAVISNRYHLDFVPHSFVIDIPQGLIAIAETVQPHSMRIHIRSLTLESHLAASFPVLFHDECDTRWPILSIQIAGPLLGVLVITSNNVQRAQQTGKLRMGPWETPTSRSLLILWNWHSGDIVAKIQDPPPIKGRPAGAYYLSWVFLSATVIGIISSSSSLDVYVLGDEGTLPILMSSYLLPLISFGRHGEIMDSWRIHSGPSYVSTQTSYSSRPNNASEPYILPLHTPLPDARLLLLRLNVADGMPRAAQFRNQGSADFILHADTFLPTRSDEQRISQSVRVVPWEAWAPAKAAMFPRGITAARSPGNSLYGSRFTSIKTSGAQTCCATLADFNTYALRRGQASTLLSQTPEEVEVDDAPPVPDTYRLPYREATFSWPLSADRLVSMIDDERLVVVAHVGPPLSYTTDTLHVFPLSQR